MTSVVPKPFRYAPPREPRLDVLHADDDILVVVKPSGLLSVPGKGEGHADCLESRARERFAQARIVHRLDMDTSGVMVLALNAAAHRHLGLQFERRRTAKAYVARLWGELEGEAGEVDLPLVCDWPNRPMQKVCVETGRPALTRWQVLARQRGVTRVRLMPVTGRSHQLRVHMLSLGHPILGDNLYAHDDALSAADRLQLHAEDLEIHHPADGRRCAFHAPCPF
ncbi:pseudouridine synthase [Polymorphum gilvum]|uniref:Dual-specificity RNA pseudouridine synthase RluA n=1 Tax=Polymorphum gilvum (strain LMG 25793 / CGMCC 1.9160 / SL003B-26A1) TaxID=991905 RepID=F2IX17_POLGS|nr:pseudouridine synthase [Polymorphum gilvum]ADZ69309.1 Pseudouridylate synthase for 23S rRNA [Polymorphum gilvum SL003B-26A1]